MKYFCFMTEVIINVMPKGTLINVLCTKGKEPKNANPKECSNCLQKVQIDE